MIWQRAECITEVSEQSGIGGELMLGDALKADLEAYKGQAQCVYLDPPGISGGSFSCRMRVGEAGWETGKRYVELPAYTDFPATGTKEHEAFLRALLRRARGLMAESGSIFLHTDQLTSARARLLMDEVFGQENFRNEIIWRYQTGGRSKRYFSRKHDSILFYAKSPAHFFDITQVPSQKKAQRANHMKRRVDEKGRGYRSITTGGKTYIYYDDEPVYPDDVWEDVSSMQQKDPQRTGYPAQKPQALLERMILSTTRPGDLVADLTCGSGTALVAAADTGRRYLGLDKSPLSLAVCRKRLAPWPLVLEAPLQGSDALVDASALAGIGYYTVGLHAYTLPADPLQDYPAKPLGLDLTGLDGVDQWYAGLLNNGVFTAYNASLRQKQTPRLARELEVPLLRGTVAILIVDVLGRRSLWTGARAT
ncbi:MAG: site-specific DNA-methyltransferase [Clostridiales bacterium]|nr:site-specific DNA-methyltransferase [Clostridiales bacterium]